MSDLHDPDDAKPKPGDAHAHQKILKAAFLGGAGDEARVYTFED